MSKHQTALITGASGGLGLEFAKILAGKQYDLILAARSEGKLNSLKTRLEKEYNIRVFVFAVDLSVKDAALAVFNYTREQGVPVDVLINNAGTETPGVLRKAAGRNSMKWFRSISLH